MEISNVKALLYNTTIQNNNSEVVNNITIGEKVSMINDASAIDEVILSSSSTPHSNITITEPVTFESTTETPMNNIQNIKEMLYKINHPADGFVTDADTLSGEIGDAWDILQHINRSSDATVNANTGVSRVQLLQLTQRDDWEENNSKLFGNINLAFDKLDVNGDNTLSYSELRNFTGYQLGSTKTDFQNKVDNYAAQIQQEYLACRTMTDKLNFAIDKAVDYMEAMGMDDQIVALNRLQAENKIGFKNQNTNKSYTFKDYLSDTTRTKYWTLGSYSFYPYVLDEKDPSDPYDDIPLMLYASDDNAGLFLDTTYYNPDSYTNSGYQAPQWYQLVSTLIHELTHATAYLYSGYPSENKYLRVVNPNDGLTYRMPAFTNDTLDKLRDAGCITDVEYNSYKSQIATGSMDYNKFLELVEKTELMWGEYVAYQTDEDYEDSIAKGMYSGANEASKIHEHIIAAGYDDEPIPTGDWWKTYGKIGYNA